MKINYLSLQLIKLAFGITVFFLFFRIIINFFNLNNSIPLIGFVIYLSNFFVFPFKGIRSNISIGDKYVLETEAIIAFLVLTILFDLVFFFAEDIYKEKFKKHRFLAGRWY